MSAPDNRKKIRRRNPRQVKMVTFEVPDLFEGEFTLPSLSRVTVGQARKLASGQSLEAVAEIFTASDRTEELEAFEELEADEVKQFIDAWQAASDVEIPKSDG